MFRRKFFLIWGLLVSLAVYGRLWSHLTGISAGDLNDFAEPVLPIACGLLVGTGAIAFYRACTGRTSVPSFRIRSSRIGRTARCHQCKRRIAEYTGSNCQFCGWIRCTCGACGCSFGKMA